MCLFDTKYGTYDDYAFDTSCLNISDRLKKHELKHFFRSHKKDLPERVSVNLSDVKICIFTGNALLRRLVRIGVLNEAHMKLDYVLGLKIEDFLERRLQTQVFKLGLAKSIHHARVLIRQRHIR